MDCEDDICFLRLKGEDEFRVRDGEIYELTEKKRLFRRTIETWEPIEDEGNYRYAYLSVESWGKLLKERSIKFNLIKELSNGVLDCSDIFRHFSI